MNMFFPSNINVPTRRVEQKALEALLSQFYDIL